jgi:hypothetical protein
MPTTNKRKRAPARITATVQKSSAAIFRNIQPPITFDAISASCATFRNIPAHNAIVIAQIMQLQNHKQRKCDSTNNASVIMASRSAHNAIVISPSRGQAFVTFRNISSAYLSYRLRLSFTSERLIRIRIMIMRRYGYGSVSWSDTSTDHDQKNLGGGLAGKNRPGALIRP